MSVIGFDIGNESCVIAAAKRGGIDVLSNDEAKRETPAVVSFGKKQRFMGSAGAAFATKNLKSTISQIKRLIGKRYKEVLEELKLLPFATSEGSRGGVLIELEYLNETWTFTPVEILGMLFRHLKQIAEKNLESAVVDCVIGIPSYFTDLQRREYLDAACIAGLNPLRLMHDGTAIALGYGMYKTDLSDSGPTIVMFVDIGHCDTQVTVAEFEQGQMKILSHSFDQNLGGRDFDEVLYKHFAAQFLEKYKIDVDTNARGSLRLRAACEKAKKVLSANAEAQISIDYLIGETDVRGVITRDEFENLSAKLLERVTVPCIKALEECGVTVDKLHTVELVGSGSRIPAITRVLTSFFQREPTRTLNGSECVARGCALRCAMLSPTLRVRDYEVLDLFPYSIVHPGPDRENGLFPKGSPFPNELIVRCTENTPLSFHVAYSKETEFPAGTSPIVGHFWIGGSELSDAESLEVGFKLLLDEHGIVKIGSARMLIKYNGNSHVLDLPFSGNLYVTTTRDELHEAQKKEKFLAEQDVKVEQSKDQRNTLESFVYDTRSKLSSAYKSFATDSEKEVIINSLKETEDWLNEDSDDEFEQDYTGLLKDLEKLLEPVENKFHENARAKAENALRACIEQYNLRADSLPAGVKEMVKSECVRAEQWLDRSVSQKNSSPRSLSTRFNHAIKVFESNCKEFMRSKPSVPRHDEPVDSDKRKQPVDSDQREQPVESEQCVDSDKREKPVDSDQREQPVDSDQKKQPVDSDQKEQPIDSDQKEQPVDSDQKVQPVDSDQKEQPIDSDQKEQPVDPDQNETPVDSDQRGELVDSDQRGKLVDSDQKEQLVDLDQMGQPMVPDKREQPVELDKREQPVDPDQREQLVDSNQLPMDSDKREQSVGSAQLVVPNT